MLSSAAVVDFILPEEEGIIKNLHLTGKLPGSLCPGDLLTPRRPQIISSIKIMTRRLLSKDPRITHMIRDHSRDLHNMGLAKAHQARQADHSDRDPELTRPLVLQVRIPDLLLKEEAMEDILPIREPVGIRAAKLRNFFCFLPL